MNMLFATFWACSAITCISLTLQHREIKLGQHSLSSLFFFFYSKSALGFKVATV